MILGSIGECAVRSLTASSALRGKANYVAMDVSGTIRSFTPSTQITTQWGCPDIVINNAGVTEVVDTLDQESGRLR